MAGGEREPPERSTGVSDTELVSMVVPLAATGVMVTWAPPEVDGS